MLIFGVLNITMLKVIILNIIMLSVVILNVIILYVVILNVAGLKIRKTFKVEIFPRRRY